ncbi:hypothetical protein ACH5RR_022849 [Cinchona calisaya]|uniref:Transposase MuDR plant domain-containing protein n=1 Tax=Cinchona calisaya TaxID=153742 RepID=A0ABD2ZC54_9GENT
MVEGLGHSKDNTMMYYYVEPISDLCNGLRDLQTGENVRKFLQWDENYKVMEVYCDHRNNESLKDNESHKSSGNCKEVEEPPKVDNKHDARDEANYSLDPVDVQNMNFGPNKAQDGAGDNVDGDRVTIDEDESSVEREFVGYSNYYNDDHFGEHNIGQQQEEEDEKDEDPFVEGQAKCELGSDLSSSDEDSSGVRVKYTNSRAIFDMTDQFRVGKKFSSKKFKKTEDNYSIVYGKPLHLYANDSSRLRAKCEDPCNWYVYASKVKVIGSQDYFVKTLNDENTNCNHCWDNKLDEDYKCEIRRDKAYKTIRIAVNAIKGSVEEQYKLIWRYGEELNATHLDSTITVHYLPFREAGNPKFKIFYCSLGALKRDFMTRCRPLIGLDSCNTKGAYPGQLLVALGIDPNDGWWPIAWLVVEKETGPNDGWWPIACKYKQIGRNVATCKLVTDQQQQEGDVHQQQHQKNNSRWRTMVFTSWNRNNISR